MSDAMCTKYGCDYELDLDGQVTCTNCGAMGDDMPNTQPDLNEAGYSTGKWSDDDDMGITPFLGPNR
jgi:hypothetical protein